MNNCISSFSRNDSDPYAVSFNNAIGAWDYLVSMDYVCSIRSLGMSFDERVKFCRWCNGRRCEDNEATLVPVMGNI